MLMLVAALGPAQRHVRLSDWTLLWWQTTYLWRDYIEAYVFTERLEVEGVDAPVRFLLSNRRFLAVFSRTEREVKCLAQGCGVINQG